MSDFGIWHDVATDPPPTNVPLLAFFVNPCGMDRIVRAEYAAKHTLPLAAELEGGCTCGEEGCGEDDVWCAEGWYESNEFDEYSYRVTEEVTHWMRLPKPPPERCAYPHCGLPQNHPVHAYLNSEPVDASDPRQEWDHHAFIRGERR